MYNKFFAGATIIWSVIFLAACMQSPLSSMVYDPCGKDVICITMTPTSDAPMPVSTPSAATFSFSEAMIQSNLGWKSFDSDIEYGVAMTATGNTLSLTTSTETISILANNGAMVVTVNGVLVQSKEYSDLTTLAINMHVWNRVFRFTGTEWQRNGDHIAGS